MRALNTESRGNTGVSNQEMGIFSFISTSFPIFSVIKLNKGLAAENVGGGFMEMQMYVECMCGQRGRDVVNVTVGSPISQVKVRVCKDKSKR